MPGSKVANDGAVAPQNQLVNPYTGLSFAECLARLRPEDE
jgi:hypothetical protein